MGSVVFLVETEESRIPSYQSVLRLLKKQGAPAAGFVWFFVGSCSRCSWGRIKEMLRLWEPGLRSCSPLGKNRHIVSVVLMNIPLLTHW
jgi:hypothetical protein